MVEQNLELEDEFRTWEEINRAILPALAIVIASLPLVLTVATQLHWCTTAQVAAGNAEAGATGSRTACQFR